MSDTIVENNVGKPVTPFSYFEALAGMADYLEQIFAWATGAPLHSFELKKRGDHWMLLVKTASVQRGALVAFFYGRDIGDCVWQLEAAWRTGKGIDWKPDKFA